MSIESADQSIITGSITSNYFRFVIPSILGLLAISSAGIVDGIFVGNYIGSTALAAVNMVMPMYYLFFGICVMISVGSAVMAGKAIGEGSAAAASNLFSKTIIVIMLYAIGAAILAFNFAFEIASFLGAKGDSLALATEYIQTVAPFLFFMGTTYALSSFARVDSAPNFALVALIMTAATNVLFDFLFIKVFELGVFGAALATGASYITGSCILLLRYLSKKAQIRFVKPFGSWLDILRASYNGFSEFINEISGGILVFTLNWVLMLEIGPQGVAAFTVANYLLWLSIMIGYGIAEALGPLVSVNFGAKQAKRISHFVRLGISTSAITGIMLASILLLYPEQLIAIFLPSTESQTIEITMMIIVAIWPAFLFNAVNISISGYFTGIQAAKQSGIIALSRSLILPLTLVLIFWKTFGLKGVFFAIPVAECATFVLSLFLLHRLTPHRVLGASKLETSLIEKTA